jgi:hypothetical protein
MVTIGGATTVKVTVCEAVVPPESVTESLNVCAPGASGGLVCGLAQGLITVNESHWQEAVLPVPPPSVNDAVTGDP